MSIHLTVPPKRELKPRIVVFGIGGAGGNAVNNMVSAGLEGVDFVVANTDAQALAASQADRRIQMGSKLTEGLGAGSNPEVGRQAARGFDLEEAWLQVMAERALIHGEYEVAQVLVQELVAKLEGKARDSVIRHFWALTHWLAVNRSAQIKTFPLQAQPSGGGNCRDRFSLWSWHLANGNTQEAHAVARALWEKGYRHPRMAFYATLAGTSYPPEGVENP